MKLPLIVVVFDLINIINDSLELGSKKIGMQVN